MTEISRRSFVRQTSGALAGISTLSALNPQRVLGANNKINLGCIGVGGGASRNDGNGGMGENDMSIFIRTERANVVGICDLDSHNVERSAERAEEMQDKAPKTYSDYRKLLENEKIGQAHRRFLLTLDCRYVKQYHEVSYEVPLDAVRAADAERIKVDFHTEHNRLYGYSLEDQATPVEIINVRVQAVGVTEKPAFAEEDYAGADPTSALKGEREVVVPETAERKPVPVYDGHATRFGHSIAGPAIIEQQNTSILVTATYDCVCDAYGSFAVYLKGREDLVKSVLEGGAS